MGKFSDQIKSRTEVYNRRARAIARTAIQTTVNDMMTPVSDGGRLRVDTGFMLNSGGAALNSIPSGPSEKGESGTTGEPLPIVLLKWKPGDTVVFGLSASYARYRESEDGFVRGAAEKWQGNVRDAVRDAKARIR